MMKMYYTVPIINGGGSGRERCFELTGGILQLKYLMAFIRK